ALVRALRALLAGAGAGARRWVVAAVVAAVAIPLVVAPPSRADEPGVPGQPGAPVLTAGTGERTAQRAGTVGFESTEDGTYHYLVHGTDEAPPTAEEVLESGSTGPMAAGPNVLELSLETTAAWTVLVVGTDLEGNDSNLVSIDLEAWGLFPPVVTVSAGGSVLLEAEYRTCGSSDCASYWAFATPDPGYLFSHFRRSYGGGTWSEHRHAPIDSGVTAVDTSAEDSHRWYLHVVFAKEVPVVFHLGAPQGVPDWSPGVVTAWTEWGIKAPAPAPDLDGYRFVGWYPSEQALDAADPDQAWIFTSAKWWLTRSPLADWDAGVYLEDLVDPSMVDAEGTVHLYGAWASTHGVISYDLGGSVDYPATTASVGPDRAEIGSRLVEADSYGTAPVRAGHRFTGWAFDADGARPVTAESTLDSAAVTLYAQWAAGPRAVGDQALVGLDGAAEMDGRLVPGDAAIASAEVTADASWAGAVEAGLDGTVEFDADGLAAGLYEFTVRYTDAEGLSVDAGFAVTVAAGPAVRGRRHALIPQGGTAEFELSVTSVAGIASAVPSDVPEGAAVRAGLDGRVVFEAGPGLAAGAHQFAVAYTDKLDQVKRVAFMVFVQGAPAGAGRVLETPDDLTAVEFDPLADVTAGSNLQALTAESFTAAPERGSLELLGSGLVRYAPGVGWAGDDPFTVAVCDDLGQCADLVYTARVARVHTPPEPVAAQGASRNVALGGRATLEGSVRVDAARGVYVTSAQVSVEEWRADSVIEARLDGQVDFEAGSLAPGEYTFTVTFTDSEGSTDDAVYTVTVIAPPVVGTGLEAPVALGGRVSFAESVTTGGLIASRAVTAAPAAGRVELGSVVFHAESAAPGRYPFEVTYTDDVGQAAAATYTAVVLA
ncbi:MAG: InlB B-repeat-containing protein, partial [Bifidobacteriaceae bacterium]|nr:InlB B-repeat-containing protein [Bifidobacteriaceae bacterium]